MTYSDHERAREFIVLGEDLPDAQQTWLRGHLQDCADCRDYREAASQVVRGLRSQPLAADSAMVQATQMRVRARGIELRQQQERMWLVCLSCLFVGMSAAITTPLFWRAFEWMGEWASVSNSVWQMGFALFWTVPALVVSAILLARGTHLANHGQQQWR